MNIVKFLRKFSDTYRKTLECEQKILMEKQREKIDSLKVSVSMSENLNDKELLELAHKYVMFVEDISSHKANSISIENIPSYDFHSISIENIPSDKAYWSDKENSEESGRLCFKDSLLPYVQGNVRFYQRLSNHSIFIKDNIRRKKVL